MCNRNHNHGYPVRVLQSLYKDLETDKPTTVVRNPNREHVIGIISDMLEGYTTSQLRDMAVRNGVVRRQTVKRMMRREIITRLANSEYRKKRSKGHFGAPSC